MRTWSERTRISNARARTCVGWERRTISARSTVISASRASRSATLPAAAEVFFEGARHGAALNSRAAVGHCTEGLAFVAVRLRRPVEAAELFGAARAIREMVGGTLWGHWHLLRESCYAAATQALDDATFAAHEAAGYDRARRDPFEPIERFQAAFAACVVRRYGFTCAMMQSIVSGGAAGLCARPWINSAKNSAIDWRRRDRSDRSDRASRFHTPKVARRRGPDRAEDGAGRCGVTPGTSGRIKRHPSNWSAALRSSKRNSRKPGHGRVRERAR